MTNSLTDYTPSQLPDTLEDLTSQLPDTLEDLTQFVLVGKAKLQAYMLKLQTVNRLSVAQEIRDQTLRETQEISNALIAAEQRIGELLLAIPTAQGKRTDMETSGQRCQEVKTKTKTIEEMGYGEREARDFQQMAQNPEIVQKVIDDALANGTVVTKSQILKEIRAAKDEARKEQEEVIRDLKEERDYLQFQIQEMEEAEPKTVVPDDYESAKRKAKKADAYRRDYESEKNKVTEKQKEILRLQDRIAELEGATKEGLETGNLSENVYYFCMLANNFVGNVGGLVWLTERIEDMPEKEKALFLKAALALEHFSLAFVQNMERNGYGEKESS